MPTVPHPCGPRYRRRLGFSCERSRCNQTETRRIPAVTRHPQTVVIPSSAASSETARTTVARYEAIGFSLVDSCENEGALTFARLEYGECRFALSPGENVSARVSLWVITADIEATYTLIKARQRRAARALLAGDASQLQWPFDEDLYSPFYGGRQFSVRDPNGLSVVFYQPA